MKTTIFIAAMLTTALSVSAQSASRTTKPDDRKTASTETRTVRSTSSSRETTATPSRSTNTRTNKPAAVSGSRSTQPDNRQTSSVHKGNGYGHSEYNRSSNAKDGVNNRNVHSNTNPSNPNRSKGVNVGRASADHRPTAHHVSTPVYNQSANRYVYPRTRIKYHYHADTRDHKYMVRYYPRHTDIIWTRGMHKIYLGYYPWYTGWHYNYGYRIRTLSSFDASFNMGEVARVYGRVYATWYNNETDDYLLFFGGEFPHQHLTVIVPGNIARRFSWRPENYFLGQHVTMTGLITSYEGKPEIVIHSRSQFSIY